MFCIVALIVFSILGIFSATHRILAREAFNCVFRKITFKPCNTDFKEKIRGKLVGKLLNKSVVTARIFNRHFELISGIFFILMIVSTFGVIRGGYNYYLYGNCEGPNQSGFCVFDPLGENFKVSQINTQCSLEEPTEKDLTLNGVNLDLFPSKNIGADDTIVFIGCYECDYTRKAYPVIQKLIIKNQTNYVFAHYPAKEGIDNTLLSAYGYCAYQQNQDKFWKLNDLLFQSAKEKLFDQNYLDTLISEKGLDIEEIRECITTQKTKEIIESQLGELQKTHLYGTPTVFINGEALVGPKPYRVYERILKK